MAFVPIHNHSDYSLLDGASQLPLMVQRAKELGMPALALTDHGVMYGAIELLKLCKAANIKPIIGNEMYVINGSIDDPQPKKEKRYHLVVLAKNQIGYENLVKLTTLSHLNGVRGRGIFSRPCIDKYLFKNARIGAEKQMRPLVIRRQTLHFEYRRVSAKEPPATKWPVS